MSVNQRHKFVGSHLFDFCKVVIGVFIQYQLADGSERELAVRPDFRQIENVVAELLSLLGGHSLLQRYEFDTT